MCFYRDLIKERLYQEGMGRALLNDGVFHLTPLKSTLQALDMNHELSIWVHLPRPSFEVELTPLS